jgi:Pyridoxamine 5'-phosphate oxidase
MPVKQGSLELLQHPASKELLQSTIPARLAYVWTDGTPRVIPIWFHWNERAFVLGTPAKAPKLKALAINPQVALTIDGNTFPHKLLLVRGSVRLECRRLFLNTHWRRSVISETSEEKRGSRSLLP